MPILNPRSHSVSNTDEEHKFGRALYDEVTGHLDIAFKPKQEGDTGKALIDYGSDIPDNTEGRRYRNSYGRNPSDATAATTYTNSADTRRATDKVQHTVNFDNREYHQNSC